MDAEYGVKVSNKFSALDDEDVDPFDLLARYVDKEPAKVVLVADAAADVKKKSSINKTDQNAPSNRAASGRAIRSAAADKRSSGNVGGRQLQQQHQSLVDASSGRTKTTTATTDAQQLNGNLAADLAADGRRGVPSGRGRGRSSFGSRVSAGREGGGFGGFGANATAEDEAGEDKGGFDGQEEEGFKKASIRGGRGGRQWSRGRPAPFRGRQFDRQSGTGKGGVRSVDKRDGSGSYNWGTAEDELVGETEELATETPAGGEPEDLGGKEAADALPSDDADDKGKAAAVEELTLDEWRAKQAPRSKPQFNTRKAGEGEANNMWNALVPLERETIKQEEAVTREESDDEPQPRQRKKEVIEIGFTFRDADGRGIGARRTGRGAGRGGRGSPRGRGAAGLSGTTRRGGFRSSTGRGAISAGSTPGGGGGRVESQLVFEGSGAGKVSEAEGGFSSDPPGGFGFGGRSAYGGGPSAPSSEGMRRQKTPYKLDDDSFPQLSTK